jgi:hypothetical protein
VKRSTLIVMQLAGAISIVPYPAVFLASIMQIAGSTEHASIFGIAIAVVLSVCMLLYPVIWVVLWFHSWKAFKDGQWKRAAWLSAPPLVMLAAGVGLMILGAVGEFLME